MRKIKYSNIPLVYPVPAVLIGARVDFKPNYSTLGNCGIVSVEPPVMYISSHKSHYTNIGIKEAGYFSINVPPANLVIETDYCG